MKLKHLSVFLLKNKTTGQTVAKNTIWLSISEISSRILKMIIIVYAARILGAEGWGIFSYTIALAGFFSIFSNMGLDTIVTREIIQNPEQRKQYISTAFFVKIFLLLFSTALIIFIAPHLTKIAATQTLFPIVALLLAADGLREFLLFINRASEKMELEAAIKIFTNLTIAGLAIGSLIISPRPISLAIAYLVGSSVGLLVSLWIFRSYFQNLLSSFSRRLIKPLFSASWPLALSGILGGIMITIDIFMLGWFLGANEVGLYSAAQRPVQLFYIIPTILSAAIFPTISRFVKSGSDKEAGNTLEKAISISLLLGIPLTFGGITLGREIIPLLFGNEYAVATVAFQMLVLTILLASPAALIGSTLIAYGEQKVFAIFTALGTSVNVLLNLFLIPIYGIGGAAIATILSKILLNSFFWIKMKQVNYFSILPHIKRMILAAVIMLIITFGLRAIGINIIINIVFSAGFYLLLLRLFKEPLLRDAVKILKS